MTFNTGKLLFVFVPVAGLLFASCPRLKCGMGRGRFTVLMVKVVLEMSATGVWKDTVGLPIHSFCLMPGFSCPRGPVPFWLFLVFGTAVARVKTRSHADKRKHVVRRLRIDRPLNAQDKSNGYVQAECRRTAGAEEWKRNTDDRSNAENHGKVDERLEANHGSNSVAGILCGAVYGGASDLYDAEDDSHEEQDGDKSADDTEFLSDDRKDHIVLALRHDAVLGVIALEKTFAEKPAVIESGKTKVLLIRCAWVLIRVPDDDKTLFLEVREFRPDQRNGGTHKGEKAEDVFPTETCHNDHAECNEQEYQSGAVISGDGDEGKWDECMENKKKNVAYFVDFVPHRI